MELQNLNLDQLIIFENHHFIIANKPPLILVHPTPRHKQNTLIQILQNLHPNSSLNLIHRLDRETSGLILVAKNKITCSSLGKMMEHRQIQKKYIAIVQGAPHWSEKKFEAPLGFMGINNFNKVYLRQTIKHDGAPATTLFKLIQRGSQLSILEATPITGRLHQIRVHLSALGLPIVGDKIYGKHPDAFLQFIEKGWTPSLAQHLLIPRHALHAYTISFQWLGEQKQFYADWPHDLLQLWQNHEPTSALPPLIPQATQ